LATLFHEIRYVLIFEITRIAFRGCSKGPFAIVDNVSLFVPLFGPPQQLGTLGVVDCATRVKAPPNLRKRGDCRFETILLCVNSNTVVVREARIVKTVVRVVVETKENFSVSRKTTRARTNASVLPCAYLPMIRRWII
jgi:hypothetical protein